MPIGIYKRTPEMKTGRYKRSDETKKKISESIFKVTRRGEKSNFWKGGIDVKKIDKKIRSLSDYRIWRDNCFKRDSYTCKKCGFSGNKGYITVHHIKSFVSIIRENNIKNTLEAKDCSELWDINNGITLCENCHSETDNYKGRACSGKKKKRK